MIRALYNLGKIYEKKNGKGYEFEDPNLKEYYNNILKMKFEFLENKLNYLGIELEEFTKEKLGKYLYSKGSPNGGDNTPTTIISKPEDPLDKIIKPIKKIEINEFKEVLKYLEIKENYDEITEDIKNLYKSGKEGYILTLVINDKWVGDWEEISDKIISNSNENFYFMKSIGESRANNKICYCCKKNKEEVYGFVNTYNFYTVDKKGFVSGGFEQKKAWKNYPICSNCATTLENGKKYLENKFIDKFMGFTYMVIPKTIFEINNGEKLEDFEYILEKFENKNKISVSQDRKKELFSNEQISTEAMSYMENNMMFNIMFYEKSNNAFKILLNIEDILPSRLKKIFDVKLNIEKASIFQNLKGKDENKKEIFYNLLFNFAIIRDFFPNKKIEGDWDKNFLDIVNSIFINKKVEYNFIINNFLRIMIPKINKNESVYIDSRKSLLIIEFLIEMEILKNKEEGVIEKMIEKNEKNEIYLNFFEEHQKVFDNDTKRALFLEGIMIQKLLNQPEQQQSKQFYSRLNSLKMNEKIVKRVFVEAINKLNEYKKAHYYLVLEKLISEYFTKANFKEISNDEMSYYFVLGMNLADKFKKEKEENE